MDPHARRAPGCLRELRANGVTMLLTTHAMDEAEAPPTRFIVTAARVAISGNRAPLTNLAEVWRASSSAHQCQAVSRDSAGSLPAPAPAPPAKKDHQARAPRGATLMRNAEQLLLALVSPLAIFVAGRFASASTGSLELLGPSVSRWQCGPQRSPRSRSAPPSSDATECWSGWRQHRSASRGCSPEGTGRDYDPARSAGDLGWCCRRPRLAPTFTPLSSGAGHGPGDLGNGDFVCLALLLRVDSGGVHPGPCQSDLCDLAHRRSAHPPVARYPAVLRR